MTNVAKLYEVSINQCANMMLANRGRTTLVQGHMGSGKSSILKLLGSRLPNHVMVYFDCTTKDLGDMALPVLQHVDRDGCVRFIPNEELGIHFMNRSTHCSDEDAHFTRASIKQSTMHDQMYHWKVFRRKYATI